MKNTKPFAHQTYSSIAKSILCVGFCLAIITAAAPLEDVWQALLKVKYRPYKDAFLPQFDEAQKQYDNQIVTLKGYMYPLEESDTHKFFMLSYYPVNICYFCGGAGPESVVEVSSKTALKYTTKQIAVRGKLRLNANDPERLFYIMLDAEQVK